MRRTQLRRDNPLAPGPAPQRRTPLGRETGLQRVPWSRAVPPLATGTGRSAAGQKKGGNSGPTPKVRKMVLERDGYACVCCGLSILGQRYSLAHRLRASQGGKPVPSNLLTFLGWGGEECHGRIDSRRDPADEAKGYTVRSWQDPVQIPVMLFSEGGSGATVWLDDAGNYRFEPPEGTVSC